MACHYLCITTYLRELSLAGRSRCSYTSSSDRPLVTSTLPECRCYELLLQGEMSPYLVLQCGYYLPCLHLWCRRLMKLTVWEYMHCKNRHSDLVCTTSCDNGAAITRANPGRPLPCRALFFGGDSIECSQRKGRGWVPCFGHS